LSEPSREELAQRVAGLEQQVAELTQERRVLRTLIDNLPDGIYAKDPAGRKILANPADLKVLKCRTEAEALGKTDFDLFPKDIAARFFADDQKVIQGQPVINREEYFLDEAGQKHWLLTSKLPLRNEQGKIVGLVGISRDITERKRAEESMADAYWLLQAILDNLPDRVYFKDAQSRFVQCNQAVARRVGMKDAKQVIGKTDFDFYSREKAEEFRRDEQKIMQAGQPLLDKIEQVTKPDGEVTWTSVSKVPLRDQDGQVMGLVGISRDITELKRTEVALRQSQTGLEKQIIERTTELSERNAELARANETLAGAERLLQALLDNIPDRIYFKDAQSRFIKLSRTLAQRLGLEKPDQAIGKTDFDFIARERASEFFADEQRIIRTGEPLINKIERQVLSNGETAWTSTTKVPLRDQVGKVFGIVGINRDITDQKLAEEALLETRNELEQRVLDRTAELAQERLFLRTLIDALPVGVYTKDTAGRKTLVNPADLKNLGCKTEAEAIGKNDFDLFPKDLAEKFWADDQKVLQGEPVSKREEYVLDENGQKRWLLTSKLPVRDKTGKVVGLLGINRDITERKQAEDSLRHAYDELEKRVAERTAELTEKNTALQQHIAERKQAEAKLAYEQELFQTLLETIPDNIYFKDRESCLVRASRSKVEATLQIVRETYHATHPSAGPDEWPAHLTGVETFGEWLVGKTDFDTYPEAHARAAYEDEQEIIRTGRPKVGMLQKATLPDGKVVWWLSAKVPWRDKDGNIVGTFGVSTDVTALKQTEEELATAQQLLQAMLDNIPDRIYFKDTQSRFLSLSQALAKRLDLKDPKQAIGKTDFDFHPREKAQEFFQDEQRIIQSGQSLINKVERQPRPNGEITWASVTKVPLRDKEGKVIGLVGINRDLTDLKRAEEELERTHRQLLETSRLAGMAEVATDVLHNVGNVLNSVNVSAAVISERLRESKSVGVAKLAKLLREHGADIGRFMVEDERGSQVPTYLEQLAEHLDRERNDVREELKNLALNIEHIKEIVATQQNYAVVAGVTEPIAPAELLEDALRIHSGAYDRHGLILTREFEPVPVINVDKHKVLQILVNLLSNAKYACDAGGKKEKQVILRLNAAGAGRVKIEVADNGVGIAPENLTRVFAQGFTTRKGGHGFGLHSGALAAREMGGSLSVHSDGTGRGAKFTLELPVTPAQDKRVKT
jgi:PAS domain S-box-containing protein